MAAGKLSIKNAGAKPRSIRPYTNRDILVILKPGEIKEINLIDCNLEIRSQPAKFFKSLGFQVGLGTGIRITPQSQPQPQPKVVVAETKQEIIPDKTVDTLSTFGVNDGNFKHYNPNSKTWQSIRNIKEWVVGRAICETVTKKFYKVNSIVADKMVCKSLTLDEVREFTKVETLP